MLILDTKSFVLLRRDTERGRGTYVGSGVTVAVWKLVQSALRDSMGARPGRVPVTARAQLSAAQARLSKALAMTAAAKERTTATFILNVGFV